MNKVFIKKEIKASFRYKHLYKKLLIELSKILNLHGDVEVNVIITDNNGIQHISKEYKKKDIPTDVLSFPAGYKELFNVIGYNMLGDIYINYQRVIEQANKYNHSLKREWAYLFAHGLIHVAGYDHRTEKEDLQMRELVNKLMKGVKVSR